MAIKIGLLGCGTVGTGTAQIILTPEGRHPILQNLEIAKIGVRNLDKKRDLDLPAQVFTTDLEEIVNDPEIQVIVEVLGGLEPSRSLILQAIAQGKHIVTANKAVIAKYGEEIYTAANAAGVYVLLEAAVGGGIPIIRPLKESLGVNRIQRVIGIINGTTNYILTEMSTKGADFGEVLAEAQQLGYAEADPTADVDGGDAADKISILASLAFGGRVKREEVYCEGIRKITSVDINYAKQLGFVVKLLAIAHSCDLHADALQLRVHPTLVPLTHPLASVNGVFNAVMVEGEPLGQVMMYGPGAGAGATASAVVGDLAELVASLEMGAGNQTHNNPLLGCSHEHYSKITSIEEINTRFYARFICADEPGVIGHLGTLFGDHGVSLESVVQIGLREEEAEVVVVTHNVREGNFNQALTAIKASKSIKEVPSILRVL